ncbi:MAG: type IV toxin-antitoxin system AbiEi family antitoxin [Xanthomonadales bacterium]|nr:type IV toxin-antitoxin system AbiEi family antitoxin [Xanthomonadales bacterium]
MDTQGKNLEKATLDRALAALQLHGLDVLARRDVPIEGGRRADAEVTITYAGRELHCLAEVKHHLRPATLGATLQQLRALGEKPLLVADHVTPPMAERLRKEGIWFADAAGNAYIEEPPLFVWVIGRPRVRERTRKAEYRAFQPGGLRVLFALLCQPELIEQPYRKIAEYAGVAHGTVGWVMAELPDHGFMAEYRKRRVLVQYERLLVQWAEAYARTLRPKQILAQYQADEIDWWKHLDAGAYGYLLGGEPAGARLTNYLRPERITLYGKEINQKLAARHALRPAENGNVEILEQFWNFAADRPGLVPKPLVYADLLATGETRCIETAELIYRDIVNGLEQTD